MGKLNIKLGNWELTNPIIPASGTFGYGYEFTDFYDINQLGAIAIKGTTLHSRYGNPLPRIAECEMGLINSVGLQNPGIHEVIKTELAKLQRVYHKKIIANISGFSIQEYVECAKIMDEVEMVGILEVNISCPNIENKDQNFATDPKVAYQLTKAVKEVTSKPVYVKLSPNVTDIAKMAKACEEAGADGLSLVNTFLATRIDIKTGKPMIAKTFGGFSGPAIKPIALRMVYEVYEAVNIPIIGMGGIATAEDVIEMMMAGASAVQIGSANLINPTVCIDIINRLPELMKELKIENLSDIIGRAH